jgi:hypothetical protein
MSDLSEQITITIFNISTINSSLKIFNKQIEMIKLQNSSCSNRLCFKSDIVNLPIIFSLCQFNIPSFEISIINTSKGK